MREALSAGLALAPAPYTFTVGSSPPRSTRMTGTSDADYSIRQAAYDLRKLRGKQLIDKPARTHRYRVPARAARTIAALLTLRDEVTAPILAAVRSPRVAPNPRTGHASTVTTKRIRADLQTLFNALGIETP
jgi:hypothetical protein